MTSGLGNIREPQVPYLYARGQVEVQEDSRNFFKQAHYRCCIDRQTKDSGYKHTQHIYMHTKKKKTGQDTNNSPCSVTLGCRPPNAHIGPCDQVHPHTLA